MIFLFPRGIPYLRRCASLSAYCANGLQYTYISYSSALEDVFLFFLPSCHGVRIEIWEWLDHLTSPYNLLLQASLAVQET